MHCLLDGGEGTQNQRAQRRADKLLSNHVGWGCSPPRGEETRWKVCAGAAVTAATKRATGPPSCYPAAHLLHRGAGGGTLTSWRPWLPLATKPTTARAAEGAVLQGLAQVPQGQRTGDL